VDIQGIMGIMVKMDLGDTEGGDDGDGDRDRGGNF
jgi:hypothetical protein